MPSRVTVRERHGDDLRLATYFVGDGGSWDEDWDAYTPTTTLRVKEYYRHYPVVYPALKRHLPRDGEILEAGCGLGFWVSLLAEAGFDARGVDRSAVAVRQARTTFPGLVFDEGDVLALPFGDGSLAGYVSFGLAEHFREGPHVMFREAARVLRRGGVAIITVPWVSPLRRWRPGRPDAPPDGALFYQYFFGRNELERNLAEAGLRPFARDTYSPLKTLRDELLPEPNGAARPAKPRDEGERDPDPPLPEGPSLLSRTHHLLLENPFVRALAGHMILVAARKE